MAAAGVSVERTRCLALVACSLSERELAGMRRPRGSGAHAKWGVYVVMRRQCGGRQRRALQGLVGERRAPASRWQAAQQWSLVRGAARKAGGSGHASKGSPGQWVGRPVRRSLARRGAGIGASGR
jgi:hypothetical protein